jgi:hypothetical protein
LDSRRETVFADPHQPTTRVIRYFRIRIEQFFLEVFEGFIIQRKLPFQYPIRYLSALP